MEKSGIGDDRRVIEPLDHELIDAGAGRRLDRFANRLVDRPAPGATMPPQDRASWLAADFRYTRGGWFRGPGLDSPRVTDEPTWRVGMGGLQFGLGLRPSGQVGLFPEHALTLPWLLEQVRVIARLSDPAARPGAGHGEPVHVLNLFAHTGLATLAFAAAGAAVAHVDASRPGVAQARRNAESSGLGTSPIRWIVDDAIAFAERERRRGRTYQGIVVDPPAYGHSGTRTWRLEDRLGELIRIVDGLLDPAGGFVLVTAHSTGITPEDLAGALRAGITRPGSERAGDGIGMGRLEIEARSGVRLDGGVYARFGSTATTDVGDPTMQDGG